jgi:hypothetical protein
VMMASFSWIIWCLCSSVFFALFLWVNGHYRLAPLQLILGRSLMTLMLSAPLSLWIDWPTNPRFYGWIIAASLAGYYFDLRVYRSVINHGSATIARLLPLRIGITMLFWACLQGSIYWQHLFATTWRGAGVMGGMVVGMVALNHMSRHPVSLNALKDLLPGIVALALTDIFSKFAMPYATSHGAALVLYPLVVSLVMIPLACAQLKRANQPVLALFSQRAWRTASIVAGSIFALQIASKGMALLSVPDPSYFVAISMLSAVWLTLYHRVARIPDTSNVRAGLVFVAAVIVVVLCAP